MNIKKNKNKIINLRIMILFMSVVIVASASVVFTDALSISITPEILPIATVGMPYSERFEASGGTASYSYAVTAGALPSGTSLSSDGILTGTPTAGGTFNFTVTATDSSGGSGPYAGSRAYALIVSPPNLVMSPATVANGTVGAAYSQSFLAIGGTAPYSYAVTAGALPSGISLSADGTLTGMPTAGGTFTFTVTATDSSGGTGPFAGSREYALIVSAPTLVMSPVTVANGTVGTAYNQSLSTIGGTAPYTYAVTAGAMPAGISLSSNGTLTGTPAARGTFNFEITATESSGGTGPFASTLAYTLTVQSQSSRRNTTKETISVDSASSNTVITLMIGLKSMNVDGLEYKMNVASFIQPKTNRTMFPVRYLSEQLGAKVEWLSANRQVKIISENTVIFLTIGSNKALVNGIERDMDSPALLKDSYTFAPIRFIAEALGATVGWNASNPEQITITKLPSITR